MTDNKREAAAYIRVSTDEQREFSPESQLDRILSYAESHGYSIKKENIFCDNGISGKSTDKREGFKSMIEKAKNKPTPFKAILVWKFSRFARNREDSILYKSMLRKKYGIRVISVSEDIGDDKMSVLMEAMIEAMDEFYSVNLGEEVKRGMTKRAEKGKFQSRAPFGYRFLKGSLIPFDTEKEYVKLIYNLFLSGKSTEEISEILNKTGVKTSKGNPWTSRSVLYLLKNPVYAGYVVWDNVTCFGVHEPIISENDYKQTKSIIENRKKRKITKKQADCCFMKFLRCSSCGGKFCICGDGKNLQCINYIKHKCTVSHSVSINRLKKSLTMIFAEIFSGAEKINLQETENLPVNIAKLQKQLQLKYERVKKAYEEGIYSIEELKKASLEIKNFDSNFAKKNFEKKNIVPSSADLFIIIFNSEKLKPNQKEAILSAIIDKIVFYRPEEKLAVFLKEDIYNNLFPKGPPY